MWFFAILLVLVMGGIAVVAAGFGQPLAEAYYDRPDPYLPVGDIAGEDLRRARFSLAFRGYRMSEVDALLDRLARQLDVSGEAPADTQGDTRAEGGSEELPEDAPQVLPRVRGQDDTA
jgi:DivIVA domain-containing protein